MPLPLSGPISMSQFNTILGRTSNTANSELAGGTTPTVGSLFDLGFEPAPNNFNLDQIAPHAMSEWYGYTPCTETPGTPTGGSQCDPIGYPAGYYLEYYNCDGTTYLVYDSPACP